MLLSKIHHLKTRANNLAKTISDLKENKIPEIVEVLKRKEEDLIDLSISEDSQDLNARVALLEEQIKTQNLLNQSIMNQIRTGEVEKNKIVKDIQIVVATLKDVYSFIYTNFCDPDTFDEDFLKKIKKNNTYH
jgi:hypothetical protein